MSLRIAATAAALAFCVLAGRESFRTATPVAGPPLATNLDAGGAAGQPAPAALRFGADESSRGYAGKSGRALAPHSPVPAQETKTGAVAASDADGLKVPPAAAAQDALTAYRAEPVQTFDAAGDGPAPAAAACVDVVVTPQSSEQFIEMCQVLRSWEGGQAGVEGVFEDIAGLELEDEDAAAAPRDAAVRVGDARRQARGRIPESPMPEGSRAPAADLAERTAPAAGQAMQAPSEEPAASRPLDSPAYGMQVVLEIPSFAVADFIEGLERQAPQQVRVQLSLTGSNTEVLRQLAPPEGDRRLAGRGGARTGQAKESAPSGPAGRERPDLAARSTQPAPRKSEQTAPRIRRSQDSRAARAAPEKQTTPAAAVATQPVAPEERMGLARGSDSRAQDRATRGVRDEAGGETPLLAEEAVRMLEQIFGRYLSMGASESEDAAAPVLFRVHLMPPPPQPPATQDADEQP
jgi:hypothetical protein